MKKQDYQNHLHFGDCLDVLKKLYTEHGGKGFIDLIYIDPPFNSKRNYNVLFESVDLKDATAQKQAFADTWSNYEYLDELNDIAEVDKDLHDFLKTLHNIRISDSAVAYLTTMSIRIWYMHKLLKDTGSFYLHCDPTMSHYLKLVCDLIFGEKNFQNEIIWKRTTAHNTTSRKFGSTTDTILFYSKTNNAIFNSQYAEEFNEKYISNSYRHNDERGTYRLHSIERNAALGIRKNLIYEYNGYTPQWGWMMEKEKLEAMDKDGRLIWSSNGRPQRKIYLDTAKKPVIGNLWDDISNIQSSKESLGYPTQKPSELLERIISASTNEGDLVADFFCGCGTTIAAAQKLNRRWIGADISHLAIRLIVKRLIDTYGQGIRHNIVVDGFPRDIGSAKELATGEKKGRYDFQDWVIEVLLNGVVNQKKVADGGYDGYLTFKSVDEKKEFAIIEVKSGNVNVKNIREFIQVVEKQNAPIGIFCCFEEQVTKPMEKEIKEAGYFLEKTFGTRYPRIQILTIEQLLNHKQPDMPNFEKTTFKTAAKSKDEGKVSKGLFD